MAHFRQTPACVWLASGWQELRSGRWLTAERARAYPLILLTFYALAVVGWIALSGGLIDPNGKPIGTDFSSFYAAGSWRWKGAPARSTTWPRIMRASSRFSARPCPITD